MDAGTTTASLSGLKANTPYVYKAYSAAGCADADELTNASTHASFSTLDLTVTAIESTTATLNIVNHTAAWWYKADTGPDASTCEAIAAGTTSDNLTGLTTGTSYTYKAYLDADNDGDCDAADEIASVTFSAGKYVSNLTQTQDGTYNDDIVANSFRTGGSTTDRFRVASVVMEYGGNATNSRVNIYAGSLEPASRLGTDLTQVGSATTGEGHLQRERHRPEGRHHILGGR